MRQLPGPLPLPVVVVQVECAVPVGCEDDVASDPHRVAVGTDMVRDLHGRALGAVEDEQVLRPAARVALPGPKVSEQRRVGDEVAVRRYGSSTRHGHLEGLRQSTLDRNGVESPVLGSPEGPRRPEDHRRAVRHPAVDLVFVPPAGRKRTASGVERQLDRLAAVRRNHIHLLVAVVLAGEGNPAAVGREFREQLQSGIRSQPDCPAAAIGRLPQVARIHERDAVAVNVGESKELCLSRRNSYQKRQKQCAPSLHWRIVAVARIALPASAKNPMNWPRLRLTRLRIPFQSSIGQPTAGTCAAPAPCPQAFPPPA